MQREIERETKLKLHTKGKITQMEYTHNIVKHIHTHTHEEHEQIIE